MSKLRMLSIIFVVIAVIAWIPLTIEVFGDQTYEKIKFWGIIFLVDIIGSCICSFVRAISEIGRKQGQ